MGNLALVLVSLIVGGVLGFTVATQSDDLGLTGRLPNVLGEQTENEAEIFNSDITQFRVRLNNLFKEHGTLATQHLTAMYDNKDTSPTSRLLDINGRQVSELIGSVYGNEAAAGFNTLWDEHVQEYENYTQGLKDNDEGKRNDARDRLNEIADELGQNFNQESPNIQADEVSELMREHVTMTLGIIDAYASGNQEQYTNRIKSASDQASVFADRLSAWVVEANPDKF